MKIVEVSKTVTEKVYFEKCSLHKHLGQARNEECPDDCWVQVTGKPGRKTSHWGRPACRAKFNRTRGVRK
tara:strand:+ start:235 stop:444 length:210 start_codon:yes stop_codon:yes gene_type:complete